MSPFSSFDRQPTTQTVAAFVSLTTEVSLLCLICGCVWVFLGVVGPQSRRRSRSSVFVCVLEGFDWQHLLGNSQLCKSSCARNACARRKMQRRKQMHECSRCRLTYPPQLFCFQHFPVEKKKTFF